MGNKCREIILKRYKELNGEGMYFLQKLYRVVVVKNGCKIATYDFENETDATQCYSLLTKFKENEDYIIDEEVFLTIYYNIVLGV
ncbi:MAG: hypothetical protein J6T74_08970 [Clostridia bacterium]|nr:hypothetical protein [Clostridia bacterium]